MPDVNGLVVVTSPTIRPTQSSQQQAGSLPSFFFLESYKNNITSIPAARLDNGFVPVLLCPCGSLSGLRHSCWSLGIFRKTLNSYLTLIGKVRPITR